MSHEIVFLYISKEQISIDNNNTSVAKSKILVVRNFFVLTENLMRASDINAKSVPKNHLKFNRSFIIISLSILVSTPFSSSKIAIGINAAVVIPRYPKTKPDGITIFFSILFILFLCSLATFRFFITQQKSNNEERWDEEEEHY